MTMAKRRVSVTLDRQVAKRAADAARSQGASLSAWLNAAACRALFIEEGLAMAREWEEEHGPLTDEDRAGSQPPLSKAAERVDLFWCPTRLSNRLFR